MLFLIASHSDFVYCGGNIYNTIIQYNIIILKPNELIDRIYYTFMSYNIIIGKLL